jgi:Tfp pilus assembly protein PilV
LKRALQEDSSITVARRKDEAGFSIMETSIALVLMAVVGLGAASLFYYSVRNVSSAGDRALAMAVAQQKMEQLRNVDFSDTSLAATAGTTTSITRSGRAYSVVTTITDSNVVNGAATVKTISIRVAPLSDSASWRGITTVFGSVTLMAQRTSLSMGPNRAL